MHLISKLRRDAALYLPPTPPYQGRGRPVVYGAKVNPKEIDSKYRVSTQTQGNITTEVYQIECRLQIEFNFRDAKQFWGLDDFINVKQMPIENAANLSMFMVNVSVSKLREKFGAEHPSFGVLDLKARYRGQKYLHETIKILPQKPEPIVIDTIAEHLAAIGETIHYTSHQIRPG